MKRRLVLTRPLEAMCEMRISFSMFSHKHVGGKDFDVKEESWQRGQANMNFQTLKLERFRSVSRVFPALFRNHSGKTPKTDRKKAETFSGKREESFKF